MPTQASINAQAQVFLSPAELSYLHSSLTLNPAIRPDGRSSTQFRPLVAEADILSNANGSARVCFADGTEAVAGVKIEVEKTQDAWKAADAALDVDDGEEYEEGRGSRRKADLSEDVWVETHVEIPGYREDDALPVFLAGILTEALLASGELKQRLFINRRFHWKLYVDILLLSQPLSYPLPLLSLTTHLALLSARVPLLISQGEEDPLFSDDWAAATLLYPRTGAVAGDKPPITLLVVTIGENIIFDPSKDELAVAESVVAVSLDEPSISPAARSGKQKANPQSRRNLRLLSLRTIDPPSHLTSSGVPTSLGMETGADDFGTAATSSEAIVAREGLDRGEVWSPPRGGLKRNMVVKIIKECTSEEGVGQEVIRALAAVG
ncbi:hypothetical protein P152DRAFT_16913 [Eremomyces bilateralis CBS 781.70]|uniref:Ribosomal RNA-processing protein 42 n=1 Tax=Eremomyces bilateralis CBS 781.70 TaxID=1392243 RepID=A0A6G1GHM5_9PEZI|nr:uncharacterized protein P152DRAFT_16913 [Eremomyces bilateralis CBS 781.70]KAF1817370.1 hypothetical protein P152DRAFT_16913 [Eremomyces bilateralis CBS 781.70]